jgi:Zn-finger nucleic acid-binding protein
VSQYPCRPEPFGAPGTTGRNHAGNYLPVATVSRHMELTCPKCHGTMRNYERNGVHVDQCADCRGIFLDRGELDRLIDAENDWHGGDRPSSGQQHAAPRQSGHQQSGYQQPGYQEPGHQQGSHHQAASGAGLGAVVNEVLQQVRGSKSSGHQQSDYYKKRKKESFLGDLFG